MATNKKGAKKKTSKRQDGMFAGLPEKFPKPVYVNGKKVTTLSEYKKEFKKVNFD